MPIPNSVSAFATMLGFLAIVLWGTMLPFSRHLMERWGTLTTAAAIYLVAGGVGCLPLLTRKARGELGQLSGRYLWGCGGLMVVYTLLLYVALGYAPSREAAVGVSIGNYMWPGWTLVLSIPLLGSRASWWRLGGGLLLSTGGMVLAVAGTKLPGKELVTWAYLWPVAAAVVAAILWGLYSNLARCWAGKTTATGVPLFLLVTGVCLAVMRGGVQEVSAFDFMTLGELAYIALLPTLLAYVMWNYAYRRGNPTLLATGSYFIPILAMLVFAGVLKQAIGAGQWMACGMVVAGSLLSRWGVKETPAKVQEEAGELAPVVRA